ncbi:MULTISPECIES: ABC transporter ATP-binding protein [unclassified Sulfitobacter]|jgi:oligopeptide/dipeptide ABC transporter ATP-binding protein|uniref:ABC transporter ATP-binding protein n=1 Tax=unclassified Sulfitobacter TaxID=196795 RepID=UPI0007C247FF|nr:MULTISPECIES: oligopeptide/dipeptide ABC transporter ATP-binding protein [unclassified Sulfitobacter]KZX92030.1 oligopeptide ABC transporter ATP-binding protein [Sulfitobacter sp. HI0021]KZX95304.1 oligopeptide ABC transporter ATP-binding protein [Sulfitobacter sp. HI0027]KZZ01188.1 oligopeptide ABC transporter ATP-binding protein [Sulfitobacter sp. HI0076]
MNQKQTEQVLKVKDLTVRFPIRGVFGRQEGAIKALDGVTFELHHGEILGLVGESGCGKSTLGKTLMGIQKPTAGSVQLDGKEIAGRTPKEARALRRRLQYAYQDPGASLDPRWKIGKSLEEPLIIHANLPRKERLQKVTEILQAVGLPAGHADLFPHEISGGQQRRVGLARILMLNPEVVILDEPTAGLDVSVQATVLRLFADLRETFDLTYIFISHDLSVVRLMCHRVAVMYLGRIVEIGPVEEIMNAPKHPYTQSLLAAIPKVNGIRVTENFWLEGEPADAAHLPKGCRFQGRCPHVQPLCREEDPPDRTVGVQSVACHFAGEVHPPVPKQRENA